MATIKSYTELINRLEDVKDAIKKKNYGIAMDILCKPYPQFQVITHSELNESKESEDERIRKEIIRIVDIWTNSSPVVNGIPRETLLAWLEKQGEQTDSLTPQEAMDIAVAKCFEQGKSALESAKEEKIDNQNCIKSYAQEHIGDNIDKIEPNFKQGDTIREKETGNLFYVNSVEDFGYTLHYSNRTTNCCTMSFKYEDDYELVEHKPAWSEEDDAMLDKVIKRLHKYSAEDEEYLDKYYWLEELKHRVQPQSHWKPSDEQMDALRYVTNFDYGGHKAILVSLYEQLKKLKG